MPRKIKGWPTWSKWAFVPREFVEQISLLVMSWRKMGKKIGMYNLDEGLQGSLSKNVFWSWWWLGLGGGDRSTKNTWYRKWAVFWLEFDPQKIWSTKNTGCLVKFLRGFWEKSLTQFQLLKLHLLSPSKVEDESCKIPTPKISGGFWLENSTPQPATNAGNFHQFGPLNFCGFCLHGESFRFFFSSKQGSVETSFLIQQVACFKTKF